MTYNEALRRQRRQQQRVRESVDHAAELLLSAVHFERTTALQLLEDVRALIWREAEARKQKHKAAEALQAEVGY